MRVAEERIRAVAAQPACRRQMWEYASYCPIHEAFVPGANPKLFDYIGYGASAQLPQLFWSLRGNDT
jgi:hypothetical protein